MFARTERVLGSHHLLKALKKESDEKQYMSGTLKSISDELNKARECKDYAEIKNTLQALSLRACMASRLGEI